MIVRLPFGMIAAALSLAACSTVSPPPASIGGAAVIADASGVPAPITIADRTTLDESVGIAFETAVTAAADLATLAVKAGVVPTVRLSELRDRVAWARVSVGAVRAAYDTGNAASYTAAVASAQCAINRVRSLANGAADPACVKGTAR